MTVEFGTKVGLDTKIFYDRVITEIDGKKEAEYQAHMIAPYHKLDVYTTLGSPWHLDYTYRFSPDLTLRYMYDVYDSTLLSQEDPDLGVHVDNETQRFFNVQISGPAILRQITSIASSKVCRKPFHLAEQ